MSDIAKPRFSIDTFVQLAALVVGVVALLITLYFSIRSDRNKELTLSYSLSRLVSAAPNDKSRNLVQIRVNDRTLTEPWLLTLRLENTGTIPIEDRDVETPLSVSISMATALAVDIARRSQPGLSANISLATSTLVISHKLLNPGDWLEVEVVCEGEPLVPPKTSARISGISSVRIATRDREQGAGPAFMMEASPSFRNYCYTVSSAAGLTLALVGLFMLWRALRLFARIAMRSSALSDSRLGPSAVKAIVGRIYPTSTSIQRLYVFVRDKVQVDDLDNIRQLQTTIEGSAIPVEIVNAAGGAELAASQLSLELKTSLRYALGQEIYHALPRTVDEIQRDRVRALDTTKISAAEMVDLSRKLIDNPFSGLKLMQLFKYDDVAAGVGLTLCGVAIFLATGGHIFGHKTEAERPPTPIVNPNR